MVDFQYFVVDMVGNWDDVEYFQQRSDTAVNFPKTIVRLHHFLEKHLHLLVHNGMEVGSKWDYFEFEQCRYVWTGGWICNMFEDVDECVGMLVEYLQIPELIYIEI